MIGTRPKTTGIAASFICACLLALGCDPGDALECGSGTVEQDGICVGLDGAVVDAAPELDALICGDGTEAVDGACVVVGPITCGAGTEEVLTADGAVQCRPGATACGAAEAFDEVERVCVDVEGPITCGAGTEEVEGECVAPPPTLCGPGTAPVVREDGAVECRLGAEACGDGLAFDETSGLCVVADEPVQCGPGTRVDDAGEACVISAEACGPGTVPDEARGQCVLSGLLTGDCADPPVLEGRVFEATALEEGGCYLVRGIFEVSGAPLTVPAAARLVFEEGAGLLVSSGGALVVDGREDAPAEMLGLGERAGSWRGVFLDAGGAAHRLAWLHIRGAGGAAVARQPAAAGLVIADGARVDEMRGVTVADGLGYGLLALAADLRGVESNTFSSAADGAGPAYLGVGTFGAFDETSGFTAQDEGAGAPPLRLAGGSLRNDATWVDPSVPVHVDGDIELYAALTVDAGLMLRFAEGAALQVPEGGALTVDGTVEAPVVLTAEGDDRHWRGVRIATDRSCRLSHVHIERAGREPGPRDAVAAGLTLVDEARVELVDSVVRDSAGYGLSVGPDSRIRPTFARNRIEANRAGPVYIAARHLGALDAESTYGGSHPLEQAPPEARGDALPAVVVFDDAADADATWRRLDAPYRFTAPVDISGDVTVEPGALAEFAERAGWSIGGAGSLRAEGTADAPITLRGTVAVPGHWRGLHFAGSRSGTSRLADLSLSDAGSDGFRRLPPAGLILGFVLGQGGSRLERISHVSLVGNAGYGLVIDQQTVVETFGQNRLSENSEGPAQLHPAAVDLFAAVDAPESNVLTGNGVDRLVVTGGTVDGDVRWRPLGVPYFVIGDVDVTGGDTLFEVEAGVEAIMANDVGFDIERSPFRLGTDGDPLGRPVLLRGAEAEAGWWQGIRLFDTDGGTNAFRNLEIADAGGQAWPTGPSAVAFQATAGGSVVLAIEGLKVSNSGGSPVAIDGDFAALGCAGVDLSADLNGDFLGVLRPYCTAARAIRDIPVGGINNRVAFGFANTGQGAWAFELDAPHQVRIEVSGNNPRARLTERETGSFGTRGSDPGAAQPDTIVFDYWDGPPLPAGRYVLEAEVDLGGLARARIVARPFAEPVPPAAEGEACQRDGSPDGRCAEGLECALDGGDGLGICRVPPGLAVPPLEIAPEIFVDPVDVEPGSLVTVDGFPAVGRHVYRLDLDALSLVTVRLNGPDAACSPMALARVAPAYLDDPILAHVLDGPIRTLDADAPFPDAACAVLRGQWPAGENLIVVERGPDIPADGYRLRIDVEALAINHEPCALDGRGSTCAAPLVCTPRMPGPDGSCAQVISLEIDGGLIWAGAEVTWQDLFDEPPVFVVRLLDLPFNMQGFWTPPNIAAFGQLDGDRITLLEDFEGPDGFGEPGPTGRPFARSHVAYPGPGPLAPSVHRDADVLVIRSPFPDQPLEPFWLAVDIEFSIVVDAAGAYPIEPQRRWFDEFLARLDFELDFIDDLPDEAFPGRTSLPVVFDIDAPDGLRLDGLGCLPFPAPPSIPDTLPSLLEVYVEVGDGWRPAADFDLTLESDAGPNGADCAWQIRPALGRAMPDARLMLGVVGIYEPTVLTVTPL